MTWRGKNLPFLYFRILFIQKCISLLNSEYSKCERTVFSVHGVQGSGILAPVTLQLYSRLRSVDVFTHGTFYLRWKVIFFQFHLRLGCSQNDSKRFKKMILFSSILRIEPRRPGCSPIALSTEISRLYS